MKKLNYFLITAFVSVLFACHKPKPAPIPNEKIGIKMVDINGKNLIGTKLYGDSIKVFSKNDNHKSKYINDDVLFVNICDLSNPGYGYNKTDTTYIQWNSKDTDTIRATFGHYAAYYIFDKVYYNDSLVIKSYKQVVYHSEPDYNGGIIKIVK